MNQVSASAKELAGRSFTPPTLFQHGSQACSFPSQNSVFIAPDFALPLLQMQGCETFRADRSFGARPFSLCSGVLARFNCAFGSLAVGDSRLPGEREDSAQGRVVLSFTVKTG
jgi:hypothetical protein